MLSIPDQSIEIVLLPKRTKTVEALIDLSGTESFPRLNEIPQFMFRMQRKESVHVIRHHNETEHDTPFSFKKLKSFGHYPGIFKMPQQALSMTRIEPVINRP